MTNKVYCVFTATWDGSELKKIFATKLGAQRYADAWNLVKGSNVFHVEEWIVY